MSSERHKIRGSQFRQRMEKAEQYGGAEKYDYEQPRFPNNTHYSEKFDHAQRSLHHQPAHGRFWKKQPNE